MPEQKLFGPIQLSGRALYDDGQMILPTGFGKSLIYQLAPMVAKKMGHNENPVVIVVSPLVTLMEDQVKEATELGITAMQLGVHDEVDITSGRCQLLFGSPESLLLNKKWRDMLGSDVFQANVIGNRLCRLYQEPPLVSTKSEDVSHSLPLFQVVLLLLLAPALISCHLAQYPTDCSYTNEIGDHHQSGPYSIYPAGENHKVEVYCQMSPDQRAWTVIQTRMDGTVNFYRPWIQYKVGFGSVKGEHWLGLDNLHYLTSGPTKFELQVDMEDFEGNKASAHYGLFSVDSECNGYNLTVSGFTDKGAGDSMSSHNGMTFSTFDKDQDMWPENCASNFMGGFWYNKCHHANPNGVYRWGKEKVPYAVGVSWHTWKTTYDYSVKSIVMKVRPVY